MEWIFLVFILFGAIRERYRLIFLLPFWCVISCSFEKSDSEICFVGDSITYLWDLEYYFPGYYIHKHAVGGAKIQDIDNWDMSDCRGLPIIFLMGTNNIGNISVLDDDVDEKRKKFNEMLVQRVVSLEANPLWVISILPRNYGNREQENVNRNIELQNKLIENSLDSLGGRYRFIDAFDCFLNEEYQINSMLFNDGLHLNESGYEILTSNVLDRL